MAAEARLVRAAALIVSMALAVGGLFYLGSAQRHGGLAILYLTEAATLFVVAFTGWRTRRILVTVGGLHFLVLGTLQLWERPARGILGVAFGLALLVPWELFVPRRRSTDGPLSGSRMGR